VPEIGPLRTFQALGSLVVPTNCSIAAFKQHFAPAIKYFPLRSNNFTASTKIERILTHLEIRVLGVLQMYTQSLAMGVPDKNPETNMSKTRLTVQR